RSAASTSPSLSAPRRVRRPKTSPRRCVRVSNMAPLADLVVAPNAICARARHSRTGGPLHGRGEKRLTVLVGGRKIGVGGAKVNRGGRGRRTSKARAAAASGYSYSSIVVAPANAGAHRADTPTSRPDAANVEASGIAPCPPPGTLPPEGWVPAFAGTTKGVTK